MRILTAYISRDFLVTFLVTLLVFLFVMAIGNVFRVIDLFSRGVSGWLILRVFALGFPASLIFAIPMSVLGAVFLQFSRMASDREITAMKACGVSLWQAMQPPLMLSVLLSILCVYINCSLAPNAHYERRKVLGHLGIETPLNFLDEGRFIRDFPGYTIHISSKEGHTLRDIVIYELGENGVKQTIRAASGTMETDSKDKNKILINLRQVRIEQVDEKNPNDLKAIRRLSAEEYPVEIDVAELINREVVWKKRADLTMMEIIKALHNVVTFSPDDLVDIYRLARIFSEPADPLSLFIASHFKESTQGLLKTYDGSATLQRELRKALCGELNLLIAGPNLYAPERFAGVQLNDKTLALLACQPEGEALIRLNRMLLEDAAGAMLQRTFMSELNPQDLVVHRMSLMVEANTRMALSLSCFAFVLLGAALGVKIHRKENLIGVAITLGLVFIFYFFIIIADSMVSRPQYQPHLIVWVPFIVSEFLGYFLIRRAD